jgi:MSHA biogenesis protein MshQ
LKFVDAGLILSDATSIATALATTPSTTHGAEITIPSQVAGVASLPYLVRAVKTDKVTKACVSAVNGLTMPTTVDFAYECNDPTTCATGKLLSVSNGTTATTVQSNDNGSTYAYTGISLSFDANGNATTPITLSYEDVGQITLRMHMNVGTNNTGGANLFGNSNSFIVVPHHLLADVCGSGTTGDCTANTAAATSASTVLAVAGTVSTQTGTGFKASVRAMSANDNVTPSFGKAGCQPDLFGTCVGSNKTETVTLTGICTAPIVLPATTCLGGLHGTVSYFRNDATNGVLTTSSDLTWDEVGLMKLTVSNSTFMGIASGAKGTSADAGRFRPDHFDTAATGTLGCASPTPFATCPPGNMVYSAQNFAGATFTALNAAGSTTSNYQAAFAKTVTLSAVAAPGGAALASGALTAPNIVAGTFISGVATATVAAANFPLFTLADLNPLDVYLRALDADNVTSLRTIAASSVEGGVKVVAGRIKIGNAYGSEKLELAMPFTVQLFDGTQWRVSTTDSSTQMNTNKTVVGNISTAGLAVNVKAPATKTITSGNLVGFKLAAPNVAGKATVSVVNSAANNLDYLLTNMITGEATFGIYKGSNEFIYMREAY